MEAKCWFCGRTAEMVYEDVSHSVREIREHQIEAIQERIDRTGSTVAVSLYSRAKSVSELAKGILEMRARDVLSRQDTLKNQYVGVEKVVDLINHIFEDPELGKTRGFSENSTVRSLVDSILRLFEDQEKRTHNEQRRAEKLEESLDKPNIDTWMKGHSIELDFGKREMVRASVHVCEPCRQLITQYALEAM